MNINELIQISWKCFGLSPFSPRLCKLDLSLHPSFMCSSSKIWTRLGQLKRHYLLDFLKFWTKTGCLDTKRNTKRGSGALSSLSAITQDVAGNADDLLKYVKRVCLDTMVMAGVCFAGLLEIHLGLGPKMHYTVVKRETRRISTKQGQKYDMKEVWYNRMCTSYRASCLGRLSNASTANRNLHFALSISVHASTANRNLHFALSISIHASTTNRCFRGVRVATSTGSAISSPVLEMRKILGSAKGYTVIEAPRCWEIHVRVDARAFLVARCFSEHVEQLCSAQTLGESVVNQLGREIPRPETWQTK